MLRISRLPLSPTTPLAARLVPTLLACSIAGACGAGGSSEAEDDAAEVGTDSLTSMGETDLPTEDTSMSSDTADTDGGSDDGSSGAAGPNGCGDSTFVLTHQPTNVVLVLDKSFSMVDPENLWDHDNDAETEPVTRWTSLHNSVSFMLDEFDTGLNFGAVLFPSIEVPDMDRENACLVGETPDADVASENGASILDVLPGADAVDLFGGTPASAGITTSLEHLRSLDGEVPRALILLTDGAANCAEGVDESDVYRIYDEALPELVAAAYADEDIPTYVIGIDILDEVVQYPMDNPFVRLNEVAVAGGFPRPGEEKFYNAQDEEELRLAMSQISSQIGCILPLDEAPVAPDLLVVEIDGETIPQVDECSDDDEGWRFTNPEGPYDEIELCAAACHALHESGALEVNYVCVAPG